MAASRRAKVKRACPADADAKGLVRLLPATISSLGEAEALGAVLGVVGRRRKDTAARGSGIPRGALDGAQGARPGPGDG